MPEFLNSDGSGLVGALSPSGIGQALQLDGSGNLKVTSTGGGGSSVVNVADAVTPANKLAVDGSGRITLAPNQSCNIAQWNGATPAVSNPVITEDQVRAWIVNGQSFSATTNKQTAAGAINAGFSIFNPAASGKTLLVYSLKYTIGNNSFNTLNLTTSDPAFGSSLTVTNNKAGSATTSIASSTFTNTNVASAGTVNDTIGSATNTMTQVLLNGDYLVLPSGNGFAFYANLSGANAWCVSAEWIEF
jgi:hypothetical protein